MRYWVHHESNCIWKSPDYVHEQADGYSDIIEISGAEFCEFITKGYAYELETDEECERRYKESN